MSGTLLGPGAEIDGFVIEAVAGRGGMGVVYRARQQRPDRVVALKVIAPDLAHDAAFRARFERESSIAAHAPVRKKTSPLARCQLDGEHRPDIRPKT